MSALVEEARPEYYTVTPTRRPSNALVRLEVGQGHSPAALAEALKMLKRRIDLGDVLRTVRARQFYVKPSERARAKSPRARRRQRKAAQRLARFERWQEAQGF
jgi:ribosomal protein S21